MQAAAAAAAAVALSLGTNSQSKMQNIFDRNAKKLMPDMLIFLHLNLLSWAIVGYSFKPDLQFAVLTMEPVKTTM